MGIARQVADVYSNTEYLAFTAFLSGKPFDAGPQYPLLRLRAVAEMARDKVKVEIYDGKNLDQPLTSILIDELEGVQYLWTRGVARQYQFAPDAPGRIDSIPHTNERLDEYGCLYGSLFQSWIGPGSMGEFFSEGVVSSSFEGTEIVHEYNCLVYLWDRGIASDNYHRYDKFYVDSRLFVVRQWDTLEGWGHDPPIRTRRREYKDLKLSGSEPSGNSWRLEYRANMGHDSPQHEGIAPP
jgi:hypothetical protein